MIYETKSVNAISRVREVSSIKHEVASPLYKAQDEKEHLEDILAEGSLISITSKKQWKTKSHEHNKPLISNPSLGIKTKTNGTRRNSLFMNFDVNENSKIVDENSSSYSEEFVNLTTLFNNSLADISNGAKFTTRTFTRETELKFDGPVSSVGTNYLLELLLTEDFESYVLRRPTAFLPLSKIVVSHEGDYVMFGLKHTTTRYTLDSNKSGGVAIGDLDQCYVFHRIGTQILLCTSGKLNNNYSHSDCMCEHLPLLCYQVSYHPVTMDERENEFRTVHSVFQPSHEFLFDLNCWYENIILPLGFEDLFRTQLKPLNIASVISDELSLFYGVDDSYDYKVQVKRPSHDSFITIPFRLHKFDDGRMFIYEKEMKILVKDIMMSYMNSPQMLSSLSSMFSLPSMPGSEMLNQLEELVARFSNVADGAADLVSYITASAPKFIIMILAGFASYAVIRAVLAEDFEPLHRVYAMLPLVAMIASPKIKDLFDFIFHFGGPQAQGGLDIPWPSVVTLLLGVVQYVAGISNPKFGVKDIVSILGSLPRASDGMGKVLDSLMDVFSCVLSNVKEHIYGIAHIPQSSSVFPKVQAFYDTCVELATLNYQGKLEVNITNYDRITRAQSEGLNLIIFGKFGSEQKTVVMQIKYFLTMLDKIRRPFEQSTIRASFSRVEPLTLLFRGASGVGKSTMSKPFIAALLSRLLPPTSMDDLKANLDSYIYTRTPETKYWDGYKGQYVTVMDDFGQCYDVAGDPDNEYMSIIRCTNRFPYVLHMASLEEKGSNVFNSKIIFCTTNETNFQTVASIKCKEALLRRFDFIVDVVVNPVKDSDGNYLYAEQRPGCGDLKIKKGTSFTTDAWLIEIYEGVTECTAGRLVQTVSFDTFVGMCAGTFLAKTDVYEDINKGCDDLLHKSISQRAREEEALNPGPLVSDDTYLPGFESGIIETEVPKVDLVSNSSTILGDRKSVV